MIKTKHHFLITIFILLVILGVAIFSIKFAGAEETTFPVDEAGIAAYVKLDSVPETEMIKVLTVALNYYSPREVPRTTSNYVIGVVEVQNKFENWKNYPHLYIGLDGWMVAYYLKDEEASRIMQWKDYTPGAITTTTLKDAIDFMVDSIRDSIDDSIDVTYSGDVKYYDFEFPDANKMTLIAETLPTATLGSCYNSFSVTVPGTLFEASYSVYAVTWGVIPRDMWLRVDDTEVFRTDVTSNQEFYGLYDPDIHFAVNIPHFVNFYRYNCNGEGAATVLIYQN